MFLPIGMRYDLISPNMSLSLFIIIIHKNIDVYARLGIKSAVHYHRKMTRLGR